MKETLKKRANTETDAFTGQYLFQSESIVWSNHFNSLYMYS